MNAMKYLPAVFALAAATQAAAQVTFYEAEGFRGRAVTASRTVANFERIGFNDRASSAIVDRGQWEVCEDAGFRGRCVVLRRGNYPSLGSMDMNNRISSVRPVSGRRDYPNAVPAPAPAPVYEYRRRPNEKVFEARVMSVHAVMGPAEPALLGGAAAGGGAGRRAQRGRRGGGRDHRRDPRPPDRQRARAGCRHRRRCDRGCRESAPTRATREERSTTATSGAARPCPAERPRTGKSSTAFTAWIIAWR